MHGWTGPIPAIKTGLRTEPMTQHNNPNNLPLCVKWGERLFLLCWLHCLYYFEQTRNYCKKCLPKLDIPPQHISEQLLVSCTVLITPLNNLQNVLQASSWEEVFVNKSEQAFLSFALVNITMWYFESILPLTIVLTLPALPIVLIVVRLWMVEAIYWSTFASSWM